MNWPVTRQVEHRARRLKQMIERLDVDVLRLVRLRQGDTYCEARKLCIECRNGAKCLAWLETLPTHGESPDFCPNLPVLVNLRRR